jgi:gliding motility-associated-like protein
VTDDEAPEITGPDNQTLVAADDECGIPYSFELPEATDNCTADLTMTQVAGPSSGSILEIGETTFTFETVDESGNLATFSYVVTVEDQTVPEFTLCPEDIIVSTTSGCTASPTFETPNAIDNCEVTVVQTLGSPSGTELELGTYEYEFTATDNAGNQSTCAFTIEVIDSSPPVFECIDDFVTCEDSPEFVAPIATDNCGISSISQITGPESGTEFEVGENLIEFEAIDVNGNSATCSFIITRLPVPPNANAGEDQVLCDADSTMLMGNGISEGTGTWTIISGTGTIENLSNSMTAVTDLGLGNNLFTWSLDSENGCPATIDTVAIFVQEEFDVDAGEDELILSNDDVQLLAVASVIDGDFSWSPFSGLSCDDCQDPIAQPSESILYTVTITVPSGCSMSDSVLVQVLPALPNMITPNNDGANDFWEIPSVKRYPDIEVHIYNRWGNEVFQSKGYDQPWDGTHNGEVLPAGAYFYVIDYKIGGKEKINGTINLIK